MKELPSQHPEFWQTYYQQQQTPWDLGQVAPPFKTLWESQKTLLKPGKMAVFGTGYGHDAAFFGQQGFEVIGFDYVPEAVVEATRRYGQWAQYIQADIFTLSPEYNTQFDYVLEHTCFCAIPPTRRQEYVEVVTRLLKPGRYFLGLIWAYVDANGPPFPSTPDEIQTLFAPNFNIQQLTLTPDSILRRKDQEFLCIFRKK